jgi:hypothetical protein
MTTARGELDRHRFSNVEIIMKAQIDLSLWSIIERLQRRLERQGMSPLAVDRAVSMAIRHLAASSR